MSLPFRMLVPSNPGGLQHPQWRHRYRLMIFASRKALPGIGWMYQMAARFPEIQVSLVLFSAHALQGTEKSATVRQKISYSSSSSKERTSDPKAHPGVEKASTRLTMPPPLPCQPLRATGTARKAGASGSLPAVRRVDRSRRVWPPARRGMMVPPPAIERAPIPRPEQ